jgi:hypothetical protein
MFFKTERLIDAIIRRHHELTEKVIFFVIALKENHLRNTVPILKATIISFIVSSYFFQNCSQIAYSAILF